MENKFQCKTCEDSKYVHYIVAFKHASWACPDCNKDQFEQGVNNMKANAQAVIEIIRLLGQPGSD